MTATAQLESPQQPAALPSNNMYLQGNFAPVEREITVGELAVRGALPPELSGSLLRNGPNPAAAGANHHWFVGDGMLHAIQLERGRAVGYRNRWIRTQKIEQALGLPAAPLSPTDAAPGFGAGSISVVQHAGRLLAPGEVGLPFEINAQADTLRQYDFDGALRTSMTGHPKIDPRTGEMFFFGYEADGLASTKVAYCIADRHGELEREQWFDAPYCALMHDFVVTEHYALFPVYPTTCDAARVRAGGDHWVHEMDRDSWVGVMPRYGDVADMRWFRGPRGAFCFHVMNAFEDGAGRIQLDQCLSSVNVFPFIQRASGLNIPPAESGARLARWTIDLRDGSDAVAETVIGPPGDLPVVPAVSHGRAYDHAWMLTMNPEMRGPPVFGGPVGVMFNTLLRLDFTGRPPQALALPPGWCLSEPAHVA